MMAARGWRFQIGVLAMVRARWQSLRETKLSLRCHVVSLSAPCASPLQPVGATGTMICVARRPANEAVTASSMPKTPRQF
jgi:hypothetical protein